VNKSGGSRRHVGGGSGAAVKPKKRSRDGRSPLHTMYVDRDVVIPIFPILFPRPMILFMGNPPARFYPNVKNKTIIGMFVFPDIPTVI